MKRILLIATLALFPALALLPPPARAGDLETCRWKGIDLWGKVQVVDSFPDIKVQVVDSFPDLKVRTVDSFPDKCGLWQFVDSFPDFKIQIVDSFPDIRIRFVESFPGLD